MDPNPKQHEEVGAQATGAEILAKMPSFDEHMKSVEREMPVAEKYYEQARVKKSEWVEESRQKVEAAKALTPDKAKIHTNWEDVATKGAESIYKEIDINNAEDMEAFERCKNGRIESAERDLRRDEERSLDFMAEGLRNQEMIDQIADKAERGEQFSPEEEEFLGGIPESTDSLFDCAKYKTFENSEFVREGGVLFLPWTYADLVLPGDLQRLWKGTRWEKLAKVQFDRVVERDGGLLISNEDVQKALDSMEARREENPFFGETNVNRATGEERTFTIEDNYPQLDGETTNDYASRIKRIGLKTRLVEKRQDDSYTPESH